MQKRGYTLIESLVTLAILAMVVLTVSAAFTNALRGMANAKSRIIAVALGNELMERIRNMAYDNIGVIANIPAGPIPHSQQITRSSITYTVVTEIAYIDDPLDGLIVGTNPIDTTPTDYKRAELTITWPDSATGVQLTARFAPNGLESATNTGAILITVSNSSGVHVPNASIHITNPDVAPPVDLSLTTDINGKVQLLSLPPSILKYHIEATKAGYSTDATYPATAGNPNPYPQDLTVEVQKAKEIEFYIDPVSTLNTATYTQDCAELPNFSFNLFGKKEIGLPPPTPVLKYDVSHQTDANGKKSITNLEMDDYDIRMNTAGYDIAGYSPPNALKVSAGTTINWTLVLAVHTAHSLLLNIVDANTKLPITGAQVNLSGGANGGLKETGRGFFQQTDWSAGSGQAAYGDKTKYFSDSGSVDVTANPGSIALQATTVPGTFNESFTTTTNKDGATTTANWDTGAGELLLPLNGGQYDANALGQSTKLNSEQKLYTKVTLDAADNANGQTITYYVTADGVSFEQVTKGVEHVFASPGSDLRFKIELATADPFATPQVSDVSLVATGTQYAQTAELESSTYDLGIASVFSTINWQPSSQIAQVGAEAVRFQLASNNDNATWNFIGPDGTAGTYYTVNATQIAAAHDNTRYVRYKMFLQTADRSVTPTISDVAIGFTSQCTPPGQVFYGGLDQVSYTADITHPSYQPYSGGIDVENATTATIELAPL